MKTKVVAKEMPLLSPTEDNLVAIDKSVVEAVLSMLDDVTLQEKVETFANNIKRRFHDGRIKSSADLWEAVQKQVVLGQSLDMIAGYISNEGDLLATVSEKEIIEGLKEWTPKDY